MISQQQIEAVQAGSKPLNTKVKYIHKTPEKIGIRNDQCMKISAFNKGSMRTLSINAFTVGYVPTSNGDIIASVVLKTRNDNYIKEIGRNMCDDSLVMAEIVTAETPSGEWTQNHYTPFVSYVIRLKAEDLIPSIADQILPETLKSIRACDVKNYVLVNHLVGTIYQFLNSKAIV